MLKTLWRGWLVVARKIGHLQSRLILTLIYFVVMAPFALAVRWFSDPLGLRRPPARTWAPDDGRSATSVRAVQQQF